MVQTTPPRAVCGDIKVDFRHPVWGALTEQELLAAVAARKTPLDCFDAAEVSSSYSSPKLFCLEQLQLGGRNARNGGQGTDALPLRGGRCTSAVSQLCTSVTRHVTSRHEPSL